MLSSQQGRFLLAGSVNTLLDFLLLNLFALGLGLPDVAANSLSVVVGVSVSYLLNHFFVFRHPHRPTWRRFGSFFAVTGFSSLVLQNLVIYGFETMFRTDFGHSLLTFIHDPGGRAALELNVTKAVAVGVGLVWNFAFSKLVVFRTPAAAEASDEADAPRRAGSLNP